jgi:hypothetical protein
MKNIAAAVLVARVRRLAGVAFSEEARLERGSRSPRRGRRVRRKMATFGARLRGAELETSPLSTGKSEARPSCRCRTTREGGRRRECREVNPSLEAVELVAPWSGHSSRTRSHDGYGSWCSGGGTRSGCGVVYGSEEAREVGTPCHPRGVLLANDRRWPSAGIRRIGTTTTIPSHGLTRR